MSINGTTLSSGAGITPNVECGIYDAAYDTGVEGTYHVDISAISDGIQTGFETTFDVASFIEFDIIRTAQSKIDPVNNPNEFEVVIDVTSHTNATDIQIVESVPSVFDIISDGNVTETADGKSIIWDRTLQNSTAQIRYTYSVPLIFPELFPLGEAVIHYGDETFTEARPWFVANDPETAVTISETLSLTDRISYPQNLTDTILFTDSVSKINQQNLTDTIGFTDRISYPQNLTDTILFTDSVSKINQQNLTETVSLTDSASTLSISFPDDWNKKVMSTNSAMVNGTSNLTHFPILVTLTSDSDLSTSKVGSSGQGIRFTSDGTTLLDYEIEKYTGDANSGTLVAWVEVPTLDYDDRTYIYIHYGQTGSPDLQDGPGTWDSDYRGVWHLNDSDVASDTTIEDSANNFDGTAQNMEDDDDVTGKIDGALDFDGTDDKVRIGESMFAAGTSAFTISVWVKPESIDNAMDIVGAQETSGTPLTRSPLVRVTADAGVSVDVTEAPSTRKKVNAPDMFAINEWTLVTWTRDGTSTIIYKNGVQVATGAAPATGQLYVNDFYQFANTDNYFNGILDEIRISHSARSADYIATDYNNQNTGTWQASLNVNPNHFTHEGVILSESISFTDSISKAAGVNLSESVSLTDSISKVAMFQYSGCYSLLQYNQQNALCLIL